MSEPKDPAIKLFGKTIPLPEASPATPQLPSSLPILTPGDDNTAAVDHDHDSSSSSLSPEANIDGDAEDLEVDKVWSYLKSILVFSDTHLLYCRYLCCFYIASIHFVDLMYVHLS